jgi:uncharacterized protein (TIGR03435 family)
MSALHQFFVRGAAMEIACIVLVTSSAVRAQAPSFDVASLKPSPPATGDTININLGGIRNGELTLGNASLVDCVKFAYGLVSNEQVAGPDWIKSKMVRFDVVAKSAPTTPREQSLLMLRTLLTERFGLMTHTEKRSFAHYALIVGKGGSKLHEVEPDLNNSHMLYRLGSLTHNRISMQTLAMMLSRQMGELVLDETGLKGVYELKLEWTPEVAHATADLPESGPTIFTALQEQLGLKLEGRKDAVDVLVIDHAEKTPIAN